MLEIKSLEKVYPNGHHALKNVSFSVPQGEFLVIIGLSGSGKSTMLRCVNRLHDPTSGEINFHGTDTTKLKGKALRKIRSCEISTCPTRADLVGHVLYLLN